MPKCSINDKNEITMFWDNSNPSTPSDALDCDVLKTINVTGAPNNETYLYTLVDGKVTPTDVGKEYDAQAYARNRAAEYPSIQECVHAILDDDLDALQTKRAEIKKKYPKG